ncbi:hypothetical protein KJS94_10125 [Flavihumibacter rivuli]|uniref:hypothetical protein n=1 Tax=Flavihumibacter rivuli TaxID=2838156 RepID=UPI001BDEFC73|nr:hypothetical protein [Flavihumibacter rivuli]ULQ54994.1 hypothetical protein KJS94_10125 [Flavihumibacter rivuli]
MNRIILLTSILFSSLTVTAQRAVEGSAEIDKKRVPAAVVELPYPPETVEEAIRARFAEKGHRPAKYKDYQLYRSATVAGSSTPYDVYVKAERKSRRDKESSVVYMLLAKPNETLANSGDNLKQGVGDGKEFLNDFTPFLEAFNLNLEINAQDEVVKKAEKKLTSLTTDSTDLALRLQAMQEKANANSALMEQQRLEIERQRKTLEALKSRRKN